MSAGEIFFKISKSIIENCQPKEDDNQTTIDAMRLILLENGIEFAQVATADEIVRDYYKLIVKKNKKKH